MPDITQCNMDSYSQDTSELFPLREHQEHLRLILGRVIIHAGPENLLSNGVRSDMELRNRYRSWRLPLIKLVSKNITMSGVPQTTSWFADWLG